MKSEKLKKLDKFIWTFLIALFFIVIFANYQLKGGNPAIKIGVWLLYALLALVLLYFTNFGRTCIESVTKARDELKKVVWPTRQETVQTTGIVAIFVVVISAILWLFDSSLLWLIANITQLNG